MNTDKHNGYTNYETWITMCWLTEWKISASDFLSREDAFPVDRMDALRIKSRLADSLKSQVEEFRDQMEQGSGLFPDLLNSALCRIDWLDIADKLYFDFQERHSEHLYSFPDSGEPIVLE